MRRAAGAVVEIVGYDFVRTDGEESTYQPLLASTNAFASYCNSTLADPRDDVIAMSNGFATLTPLTPDLSLDTDLDKFKLLTR